MVTNHSPASPHFHCGSIFPQNNGASLLPSSLLHNCPLYPYFTLPNSKLDDSPVFSGELHSRFGCEESSEDSPRSEGSAGLGWGSASTLEEAPNSKHGEEGKRKSGGNRGGGERGMNRSGHSVYKGVRKRKGDRWVSEIREPGKKTRIWLGTFSTPEMAASAYDVAAFNLKTPYAYLNFPEYVSSLPIPPSCSPKHIQEAAAAAAAVAASREVGSRSHVGSLVATPNPRVDETSPSLVEEQQKQLPQSSTMETKASSMIDEDMIFDMPNLLADMAEGLMITPPLHYLATATNAYNNSCCDRNAEYSLWNL